MEKKVKYICRMWRRALMAVLIMLWAMPQVRGNVTAGELQGALERLDREIGARGKYKAMRQAYADSLRVVRGDMAEGTEKWFDATHRIASVYSVFNNDSALVYYEQGIRVARAMGDSVAVAGFAVRHATCKALGGSIHDALLLLEQTDTAGMNRQQLENYLSAARQLYSYVSTTYDHSSPRFDFWSNKASETQRRLLEVLPSGSSRYSLNQAEYFYSRHEYARSRAILQELIRNINENDAEYAIACHILAEIARAGGDFNDYMYYLALSAISDMHRANMEVTSIQELGGALFEKGDTERAHRYLTVAVKNAVESRASVRMAQISQLLSVVEEVHSEHVARWRMWMWLGIAVLLLCVAGLVWITLVMRSRNRKLRLLKQNLETANKTKEVYMSQFLALCSVYMDKLKQLSNLTARKISAGQTDELYKIVKSGKFIEEQSSEFYSVFDNAFLHIYPDFTRKVNALLRPEEQIRLEEGELLNSDLRILAFMRLGIDDATRVAQILNYSVNTIYAYRNKLRNRAINRATFEADVMRI